MTRRYLLPTVLLVLLLMQAGAALAQSPFALINIGADVRSSDARIEGRGGWGLAESDSLIPSFHNIAGLPGLTKVAIMHSSYGEHTVSETTADSRTTDNLKMPSLRVALPINRTLVLTAGFRALRSTQYKIQSEITGTFPVSDPLLEDFTDDYTGTMYYTREGSQYEVPLGAAYQLRDWASVGFSLNLVRGSIKEYLTLSYSDPVSSLGYSLYNTAALNQDDDLNGTSVTLSTQLQPHETVSLGFTYTPAHTWDVTRTVSMENIVDRSTFDYKVDIPAYWAAGASLQLSKRWRVGGDFEAQNFTEMSGGVWAGDSVDVTRFSVGIERREEHRRRGGFRNLPLRMGYAQAKWPYTVNGNEIIEKRISVGTGLAFRQQGGHLDLALSYGMIGDKVENGSEDRIWRLAVSLVGFEKWW
jgi:hypothetical protein